MSLRLFLLSAFCSIVCGVLTFTVFYLSNPDFLTSMNMNAHDSGEVCLVLTFEESQDDRFIGETLQQLGLGAFISESSQTVYLDDFGVLREIPLDLFPQEIESFDPRDDGYAARLRAFFVREGKRFFFLPLEDPGSLRSDLLTNRLNDLFGEMPFSLSFLGERRPFFLFNLVFFIFYALACVLSLCFSASKKLLLYQLPVLLALSFCGFPAFIIAPLLTGIWELLRDPLREFRALQTYRSLSFNYAAAGFKGMLERLRPFRQNMVLVFLIIVILFLFFIFGDFPPLPAMVGLGFFFFIYFYVFKLEKKRAGFNGHILYTPLLLFPLKPRAFSIFPLLLPYVFLCPLLFILVLPKFSFPDQSSTDPSHYYTASLIMAEDYYRHIDFQRSFSYMPLGRELTGDLAGDGGFYVYHLGDDGLISGREEFLPEGMAFPPFPLETLSRFLLRYSENSSLGTLSNQQEYVKIQALREWLFVAFIFTLSFFDICRTLIMGFDKKPAKKLLFGD